MQCKRSRDRNRREHGEGRCRLTGNQHSVSADDSSFESCLQGAGSTFTTTFVKAGTYAYHCSIHPQMKGTVTVA